MYIFCFFFLCKKLDILYSVICSQCVLRYCVVTCFETFVVNKNWPTAIFAPAKNVSVIANMNQYNFWLHCHIQSIVYGRGGGTEKMPNVQSNPEFEGFPAFSTTIIFTTVANPLWGMYWNEIRPHDPDWEKHKEEYPPPRRGHSTWVYRRKLYIAGGYSFRSHFLFGVVHMIHQDVWKYSLGRPIISFSSGTLHT